MPAKRSGRGRLWAIFGGVAAVVAVVLVVVYVLRLVPGTQTATPRLTTTTYQPADSSYNVLQSVAGPDGSLWFTEEQYANSQGSGGNGKFKIGHITAHGTLAEYSLNAGNTLLDAGLVSSALVLGSDGNVWFTEVVGGLIHMVPPRVGIGRIDASGHISDYVLPFPTSNFNFPNIDTGLTLAPDGNLWFIATEVTHDGSTPTTTKTAEVLADITPAGTITGVPLSSPSMAEPHYLFNSGLTAAPGGSLWTVVQLQDSITGQLSDSAIARITPTGVVTLAHTSLSYETPSPLVIGADGNIWFADGGVNAVLTQVVRIAPDRQEFDDPLPDTQASLLPTAVRSGNAVWVASTEYTMSGNVLHATQCKIWSVSTDGTINGYPVPADSALTSLYNGSDGDVYYIGLSDDLQHGNNRLGQVSPSGKIVEYPVPTAHDGSFALVGGTGNTLWLTAGPGANQAGHSYIFYITLP